MKDSRILAKERVIFYILTEKNSALYYLEKLEKEWFSPYSDLYTAIKEAFQEWRSLSANGEIDILWADYATAGNISRCAPKGALKDVSSQYIDIVNRHETKDSPHVDYSKWESISFIRPIGILISEFEKKYDRYPCNFEELSGEAQIPRDTYDFYGAPVCQQT